jgi:GTP-binding protein
MGNQKTGKSGDDIVLKVPLGTEILDEDEETVLADLTQVGQRVCLAEGGNGGWGNLRFKSSTNRAPNRANPGQEGIERTIWLRLKLIADAGLVGIDGHEFVMADIPGLIEGASEGRGLGMQFLAHVERCKVLLHLVDGTSATITKDYRTIVTELEAYSDLLGDKPRILALNKTDAMDAKQISDRRRALEKASGGPVHVISGVSGKGLPDVLRALYATIHREAPKEERGTWQP